MKKKIVEIWSRIGKYGRFSIVQFPIFLILLFFVQKWQTRNLLANGSPVPSVALPMLSGDNFQVSNLSGKSVVIYLFAPWCKVCKISSVNVNRLYDSAEPADVAVLAIALDYGNIEEVSKFKEDHKLRMPVLLGNAKTARDFKISGFPTFYFVNGEGRVITKTIGFTTKTGLLLRQHL